MILATLNAWANELGVDPDTIRRALSKNGLPAVAKGAKVRCRDVVSALHSRHDDPKQRLLEAQAIEQEALNAEREGVTTEWDKVELVLNQYFISPLVQAFDAAPKEVDREWIERTVKPLLRAKLTELVKPKETERLAA